jgi:hypothetical protein
MGAGWFYTSLNLLQIFKYELSFQIDDLWKPAKISKMTLIFKDHLSVYM